MNQKLETMEAFAFGNNWRRFMAGVTDEAVREAETSLTTFLELPDLRGRTFVDVGCGSGLFSYAAFRLGAKRIVSFDLDDECVQCCRQWHEKAGRPDHWQVQQGSVLDPRFLSSLGRFDVAYSWGVLHHTGQMWQAIANSMALVDAGGFYYIALYNKAEGRRGSDYWLNRKRRYLAAPRLVQRAMELEYMTRFLLRSLIRLQNPIAQIRAYRRKRGMAWRTNIIDWLGGFPYEFASVQEVLKYVTRTSADFSLVNLKATNDLANNWFLFRKDSR
jgi:2-polyprenyl-3-methyl-5-hydroxy-6-metoxy-1,4-benzoquinol methylase